MIYELRNFDNVLIRFSAERGAEPDVKVLWSDEGKKELFPLDLRSVSPKGDYCLGEKTGNSENQSLFGHCPDFHGAQY